MFQKNLSDEEKAKNDAMSRLKTVNAETTDILKELEQEYKPPVRPTSFSRGQLCVHVVWLEIFWNHQQSVWKGQGCSVKTNAEQFG